MVDLGREFILSGVGYTLDWDAAFTNPLTFEVLVSTDNETWTLACPLFEMGSLNALCQENCPLAPGSSGELEKINHNHREIHLGWVPVVGSRSALDNNPVRSYSKTWWENG